jgi:nicotinic acid phosphoribosyltransferase
VDSGDLAKLGAWCLRFFEANGLHGMMPILTGDLDVERVKQIVAEFPEATGFGVGTKLSSEVKTIAGVIFKECLIAGRPTLKASNTPEKSTLPGRLQVFRGVDAAGKYVSDVIGLDDEEIEIKGAAQVSRLLVPFWENGHHVMISSITRQKAFVEEQRTRFADINNYTVTLSDRLRSLRDQLAAEMRADCSGWKEVLHVPEQLAPELKDK